MISARTFRPCKFRVRGVGTEDSIGGSGSDLRILHQGARDSISLPQGNDFPYKKQVRLETSRFRSKRFVYGLTNPRLAFS